MEDLPIELYNSVEDFEIIYGEYSRYYDFFRDFTNLNYYLFRLRVQSLKGFKEVLNKRYSYIKGIKMSKEEKKECYSYLNSTQKLYYEKKKEENISISMMRNAQKEIDKFIGKEG